MKKIRTPENKPKVKMTVEESDKLNDLSNEQARVQYTLSELTHKNNILEANLAAKEYEARLAKSQSNRGITPNRRTTPTSRTKVALSKGDKYNQSAISGALIKGYRRISDEDLGNLAQADPHISSIITTRAGQGSIVGQKSESKFDKGTRIQDLNPPSREDFRTDDEFQRAIDKREEQKRFILNWALNCGTSDREVINSAYAGVTDPILFKRCSLSNFVSAQVRNLLVYGRMGSQKFFDMNTDTIQFFRPVPIETFNYFPKDENPWINKNDDMTSIDSVYDAAAWEAIPVEERPDCYVQIINGTIVNFFTEKDLKMDFLQKQTEFALEGYPLAPIEQAIYMVFIHGNTLQYFKDQFVKGLGTKGILSISAKEAGAELSDEDLDALRKEFHNFLTRTDNMSTTPVISGPVDVQWIPLSATPKDMEFLHTEEHVIRALCSAFQISPQEMGYGHLGLTSPGLNTGNKQKDITQGEERGLRLVLDVVYEHLNELLYETFPQAKDEFAIVYTGVGEDTKDVVISRGIQELQTTATMNSLWADSEKQESVPWGGNIPLSSTVHANVIRYMRMGEFLELYAEQKGASKKPEYDFFIDPSINQAYMDARMFDAEDREMQGEIQMGTQMEQAKGMAMQNSMMEAQMQMMGQQQGEPQPEGAPPSAEGEENVEKSTSIKDAWESLGKSPRKTNVFMAEIEKLLRKK